MYSYIKGIVVEAKQNYIVLDHLGLGYHILVPNPFEYSMDDEVKVYVYHHVREDIEALYGFKNQDEKLFFTRLIGVKGIGPKTAIGILAVASVDELIIAIETENIASLKKVPGIGPKAAQQIILDLKGKLVSKDDKLMINHELKDAIEVLKALDYKQSEIDRVMKELAKETLDTNGYVKKALLLMVK